jgi:hypothetical protein
MDGEAIAAEKDSNAPFGATMVEEDISVARLSEAMAKEMDFDASLGDITDERARFRLRRRCTGEQALSELATGQRNQNAGSARKAPT